MHKRKRIVHILKNKEKLLTPEAICHDTQGIRLKGCQPSPCLFSDKSTFTEHIFTDLINQLWKNLASGQTHVQAKHEVNP